MKTIEFSYYIKYERGGGGSIVLHTQGEWNFVARVNGGCIFFWSRLPNYADHLPPVLNGCSLRQGEGYCSLHVTFSSTKNPYIISVFSCLQYCQCLR